MVVVPSLTTLDSATRLLRFNIEELFGPQNSGGDESLCIVTGLRRYHAFYGKVIIGWSGRS